MNSAVHEQAEPIFANIDTESELYREYDFGGRVYTVHAKNVEYRVGGTTHNVTDFDGVTHLLPAPGWCGCVIRIVRK